MRGLFHEEVGGPAESVVRVLVLGGGQIFRRVHQPIGNCVGMEVTVDGNEGQVAVSVGMVPWGAVSAGGIAPMWSLAMWAGCGGRS